MNCVLLYTIHSAQFSIFILIKPGHSTQEYLYKYKTMYKVQICYRNFLDNKLFILLNYDFYFFSGSKNQTNKQKRQQQENGD